MALTKNKWLAEMPANTLKGNALGVSAKPADLAESNIKTVLDYVDRTRDETVGGKKTFTNATAAADETDGAIVVPNGGLAVGGNIMSGSKVGAKDGVLLGSLGLETDLAVAFPLTDGTLDPASHTDANRIGWYAHRGSGGGFGTEINSLGLIGCVVNGSLILEIGDNKVATSGDLVCGDDLIALDEIRTRSGGSATDPKFAFHDNNGTYDPITLEVGWWYDPGSAFIGTTVGGTHILSTFADRLEIEATTDATLPTNGALVVAGGIGADKNVRIGGALYALVNSLNGSSFSVENFDDDWQYIVGETFSATDWHAAYFTGHRGRGTQGAPQKIQAGDILVGLEGKGHTGASYYKGVGLFGFVTNTPADDATGFDAHWILAVNEEGNSGGVEVAQWTKDESIVNPDALDHDFVVNKQTSGEAARYNAGLDTWTLSGDVTVADQLTIGSGSLRIAGFTTTSAAPTTTEYPNDKDCGIHKNTATGDVTFAYNDGGTIKTADLT